MYLNKNFHKNVYENLITTADDKLFMKYLLRSLFLQILQNTCPLPKGGKGLRMTTKTCHQLKRRHLIDEFPAELCKKGQQEAEKKYFGYSFRLRRKRNG